MLVSVTTRTRWRLRAQKIDDMMMMKRKVRDRDRICLIKGELGDTLNDEYTNDGQLRCPSVHL